MSGLKVYSPPIGLGHPDYSAPAPPKLWCRAWRGALPRRWVCSRMAGHGGDHYDHDSEGRVVARWPRDPSETEPARGWAPGARIYSPPGVGPEHPDYLAAGSGDYCESLLLRQDPDARPWVCTVARGHRSDHAAHFGSRPVLMRARWPRDPEPLPSPEAAKPAAEQEGDVLRVCLADITRDSAVLAIDQAQISRDDHWYQAAEHFVRALHALALVGSGVEAEDDGGEVG